MQMLDPTTHMTDLLLILRNRTIRWLTSVEKMRFLHSNSQSPTKSVQSLQNYSQDTKSDESSPTCNIADTNKTTGINSPTKSTLEGEWSGMKQHKH